MIKTLIRITVRYAALRNHSRMLSSRYFANEVERTLDGGASWLSLPVRFFETCLAPNEAFTREYMEFVRICGSALLPADVAVEFREIIKATTEGMFVN